MRMGWFFWKVLEKNFFSCTIDSIIVNDLTYNDQANLAYSEVNVFKFADKITTYFQCAVSTCMISEGMCKGKTVGFFIFKKYLLYAFKTP